MSTSLSTGPFQKNDPKRQEADEMRQMIKKMGAYDDTLYDKLTQAREKGVLDVLNRVLDDEAEKRKLDEKERSLINRPLHLIILESFRVIREVFSDLREVRSISQLQHAFLVNGRAKYIGVIIIVISLILIILASMNEH